MNESFNGRISGPSNVEPSADIRLMASFLRQLFVALIEQGFTEQQALQVLGSTIQGSMNSLNDTE